MHPPNKGFPHTELIKSLASIAIVSKKDHVGSGGRRLGVANDNILSHNLFLDVAMD